MSAKVDYALRAVVALARIAPASIKGDQLALQQAIPFRFLEVTLSELRHAGLVASRRGSDGGYWLAKEPREITVRDVVVAVEGSLADVRPTATDGRRPAIDADPPRGDGDSGDGDDGVPDVALDVRHATGGVWAEAVAHLDDHLAGITLADLVRVAETDLPFQIR